MTRSDYPGGILTGSYTRKSDGSLIASAGFSEIDPLGRVLQSTHKVGPLDSQTIEYRYNAAGKLGDRRDVAAAALRMA